MKLNKWIVLSLLYMTTISLSFGQYYTPEERYINKYKEVAIEEMYLLGIPASITLAQGLVESQAGMSDLAVYANNHFGIKCKNEWDGARFFQEDDDRDAFGRLRKSCFRIYDNVEDSYRDHSEFLRNRSRYQILFTYDRTDYKAWARGLKACGYATDKRYPKKLIRIIEKYRLHQYDLAPMPQSLVKREEINTPPPAYRLPDNYQPGDNDKGLRN